MVSLVVAGQTYLFPSEGDNPPWGSEVTDWAEAVTSVLGSVVGPNDITQSSATILNNQTAAANVQGLLFNPTAVRGVVVEYSVYRVSTGSGATELAEVGFMYLSFKSTANVWDTAVAGGGNAGVTFSTLPSGQVQYTSTNMTGSAYSGVIKFKAQALPQ